MAAIEPGTRLVDLTVGELLEVLSGIRPARREKNYVYGIAGLAALLKCSTSTASRIKRSGAIDGAVRQYGRTIIIDADMALELLKKTSYNQ